MRSLSAARRETAVRLAAAGIDSAALDARLIVRAATGLDDADLIARGDLPLSLGAIDRLERLVLRRIAREPVAHILEEKEFWGLALHVDPPVLIPRPDSETLVAEALAAVAGREGEALDVCDLGTGSGALIVALLTALPAARGTAIDISAAALAVARRNARRHRLGGRVRFVAADFATFAEGPFDLIVANPPYVATAEIDSLAPEVARHEPRLALDGGPDGLDAYRAIAARLPALLKPDGVALVEIGAGQGSRVANVLRAHHLHVGALAYDLSGTGRVLPCRDGRWATHAGECGQGQKKGLGNGRQSR